MSIHARTGKYDLVHTIPKEIGFLDVIYHNEYNGAVIIENELTMSNKWLFILVLVQVLMTLMLQLNTLF